MPPILLDLFRYRQFILASIGREIHSQFQGSLLGAGWVIISPLVMLSIYTLVFSSIMGSRLPGVDSTFGYSIFLCAGLLPWSYFTDGLGRLTGVFVAQANLIKKAQFPRICLPVIAFGVATFNFAVIFGIFLLFLLLTGYFPGWIILVILPALGVQILLTLGFGVLLGTLNVFFRDVGQFISVSLQFLFWLTPIVYPLQALPPWVQNLILLNPFTVLVRHYQTVFIHAQSPPLGHWLELGGVALLALLGLWLGLRVHRARAGEMADEL